MAVFLFSKNIETIMKKDRILKNEIDIRDFIDLHTDFIRDTMLENLADQIIIDHKNLLCYFKD